MHHLWKRRLGEAAAGSVVAGILACLSGCVVTPMITVDVDDMNIVPAHGMAALAVIQPTLRSSHLTLVDEHGKVLGQINGRTSTVLQIPPGPFRVYVLPPRYSGVPGGNDVVGDRIQGDVTEGKVYFGTISTRFAGIRFNALTPRSPDQRWDHREKWLRETPRIEMDSSKIASLTDFIGDPSDQLARIDEFFQRLDATHLEARTILASDGL